uniref:Tetratricopeptide repeat domain 6 n=1 Tax=Astyanax mexicanus TaxID=7994 RepID=W5JYA2_ASTMX
MKRNINPNVSTSEKTSPKLGSGQEAVKTPAIASLAGTARLVSLSKRPQPPAKPRSEKPSTAGGAFKNQTPSEQLSGEKKQAPRNQGQYLTVLDRCCLLNSSSSDEITVDRNEYEQDRRKCRKESEKKRRQLTDRQQEERASKEHSSGSSKSSSATSTIRSIKSVTELLEEARNIATGGLQEIHHQRVTEKAVSDMMKQESGHTVNDQMTKCGDLHTSEPGVREHVVFDISDKQVRSHQDVLEGIREEKIPAGTMNHAPDLTRSCKVTGLEALGSSFLPVQRPQRALQQTRTLHGLSLLATWTPKTDSGEYKTIHHLCTTPACQVLPVELQLASRMYHTQDLFITTTQFLQQRTAFRQIAAHPDSQWILWNGVPVENVGDTEQTGGITQLPPQSSDALEEWQKIAEYYVEKPRMILCGHAATLCDGQLRMFWSPAPPKFSSAPNVVKDALFPHYQVTPADLSGENFLAGLQAEMESGNDQMEKKPRGLLENILSRKHKSLMDLRAEELVSEPSPEDHHEQQLKRPFSSPHFLPASESPLRLQSDFTSISRELDRVRQQPQSPIYTQSNSMLSASQAQSQNTRNKPTSPEKLSWDPSHSVSQHSRVRPKRVLGKSIKKKKSHKSSKLAYVHKKLKELPETLTRSVSSCELSQIHKVSAEQTLLLRFPSLPLLLDFDGFAVEQGGIPVMLSHQEWVGDIWNTWFDEVFPPQDHSSTKSEPEARQMQPVSNKQLKKKKEIPILDKVDLSEALDEGFTVEDLEMEVAKLTESMIKNTGNNGFDLCRRGALYKKLGLLKQALDDLNAAISLEPHLLDAYWHRHSISLLRNAPNSALDDLNFIIKHNKKHADAFRSRAEIYRMRGETRLAILDYTQVIKNKPDDAENYFRRADLYEKTNEISLAMEDYAKTFAINLERTDALMAHALHHFHTSVWRVALDDFSLLLKQEPANARARTYRGRTFAKLGLFKEAIEDFCLAVHLDPRDWLAFYHRGCLLRRILPDVALRDLSVSVLINGSSENLAAFLYRGLLYTEQQQWQKAMADFKAVIKIDRTVAAAHINLGLIYMLKMNQSQKAIRRFSNAIKADPTNIKGYVCRARAYHNVNDLKRALKDLTRALHLRPDDQYLHIMRGQCLCNMEQTALATFCIQYSAEMKKALGLTLVQQAAVQSFLQNDAKAIACLVSAANSCPSPSILILLGKTQLKVHKFMEAVESFKKALSFLNPKKTNICNVPEAPELYYLTGVCYMAQGEDSLLPQALEAFSKATRINPDYAEAYHQRGLCRIRLQHSNSVQDFNRALCINPNFYQAYLSRAALYGAKGLYNKAIFNCSEALKIQPKNVKAYLYKGALKFYLKEYKKAVEDLTVAIEIDSSCSLAYYNRGVCYQVLQEYKLALRDYSTVLLLPEQKEIEFKVLINRTLVHKELNDHYNALQDLKAAASKQPKDASLFHSLGLYFHRLGQLQEAVEAYSEALRLSPFLLNAYVGRGNAFMDYGHSQGYKQAQRDFLSALHLNPRCSSARIGLAYNLQVFGCFQRVWNQFTVAVEVNPKCWAAYEGRAIVNLQMGNTYAAFQDINNALKCNPHSDQLLTNRGVINQFMGDKVSAMSDYQRAISLNPTCALAFFNAANLYFYNRQFEQACEYYSRAIELDPSDESPVLNRAISLALLQKIPESLQDFSEALRLCPYSAHIYFNRANLYHSLRKYKAAEREFTQALQLQPDDALLYKLRADVRGHLGLMEEAVKDYRTAVELQDSIQRPDSFSSFHTSPLSLMLKGKTARKLFVSSVVLLNISRNIKN